jgi:hypothetical protein
MTVYSQQKTLSACNIAEYPTHCDMFEIISSFNVKYLIHLAETML